MPHCGRLEISYTRRSATGAVKTWPEILPTFIRTLRPLKNIQTMNWVETTVKWEQRAVADSDSEEH